VRSRDGGLRETGDVNGWAGIDPLPEGHYDQYLKVFKFGSRFD